MASITQMKKDIKAQKPRSAWGKGVQKYALELLDSAKESIDWNLKFGSKSAPTNWTQFKAVLLRGAKDWKQYSGSGFTLVYNYDIAKRLCSPSEFKKVNEGRRNPNSREGWIDVQARALYQASELIREVY